MKREEHIGESIGIDCPSVPNSSDGESGSQDVIICEETSSKPKEDLFRKRKLEDTSITKFFKKQPKTSGPDSPMVSNSTDGSN